MKRKSEFKPLLFTTTMRSPERMKGLLNILSKFDGKTLTNKLATDIMGELMRYGLYRPMRASSTIINKWGSAKIHTDSKTGMILLSDSDIKKLLKDNPQKHKEAGFEKGWPSRFATVFDFPKELGFVFYSPNCKIEFSEIGLLLANSVEIKIDGDYIVYTEVRPEDEQRVFTHALAKSQRNNPFVRVLNENIPLVLLLEVIQKLNNDKSLNGVGISKLELPLLIFWKDNDADSLYKTIKNLRKKFGTQPSWEVIVDICLNKIMKGVTFKKFTAKSIMVEYPDEFIRKMRLTGLISYRGGGRFLDIDKNELKKANYIIAKYSNYKKYSSEKEYFNYMAAIDKKLLIPKHKSSSKEINNYLLEWLKTYTWKEIKEELIILSKKKLTKDAVLKEMRGPVRLEFLTSLAIKSKFMNVIVNPNYPCGDDGIPSNTAGGVGDKGDIECIEEKNGILVEVTMSEGGTQTKMEVWPITRHLQKFMLTYKSSKCFFIAPSIYVDSKHQIDWICEREKLEIKPFTISNFINHLENSKKLFSA
jgi:hypothetical protein